MTVIDTNTTFAAYLLSTKTQYLSYFGMAMITKLMFFKNNQWTQWSKNDRWRNSALITNQIRPAYPIGALLVLSIDLVQSLCQYWAHSAIALYSRAWFSGFSIGRKKNQGIISTFNMVALTLSSTIRDGNPLAQSRLSSPLQDSGSLDQFPHSISHQWFLENIPDY